MTEFEMQFLNAYFLNYASIDGQKIGFEMVATLSRTITESLGTKSMEEKLPYVTSILDMFRENHLSVKNVPRLLDFAGVVAFKTEEYEAAEFMLRTAYNITKEPFEAAHLAFFLRRYKKMSDSLKREIIDILSRGVGEGDIHCTLNMALLLALGYGSRKDWELADRFFLTLAIENYNPTDYDLWIALGKHGDPEGKLAWLWLLHHWRVDRIELDRLDELCKDVRKAYPSAPEWIYIC